MQKKKNPKPKPIPNLAKTHVWTLLKLVPKHHLNPAQFYVQ